MNRWRTLGLAVLTVFAFGGLTATAAQAKEGPFFKICHKQAGGKFKNSNCSVEGAPNEFEALRLVLGGSETITAKAAKPFIVKGTGFTIECEKMSMEPGATINGSNGGVFSFYEAVILFDKCTVAENGAPCEPYSEKFGGVKELGKIRTATGASPQTSITVTGKLAWPKEVGLNAGEPLLMLWEPKATKLFAALKFTGAGCKVTSLSLTGSVAAEAWQSGKSVGLGLGAFTVVNQVNFPKEQIKEVFLEETKGKKKVPAGLIVSEKVASLEGEAEIELSSKQAWGVFGE
jgi:hypothetical protein